jgi:sugar porter (SP) family MFS transporter
VSNARISETTEVHDRTNRRPFVILTSITIALGGFLFGYDTAIVSGAILFVRKQFNLGSIETEIAVSIVLAGALLGAGVGGYLGDRFGRRPTMIVTALAYALFGVTTGLAHGPAVFTISRFLVGVAVGISSMLTPLYIAEISPENIRGALVTLNQIAIATGVVLAYYVDYLLADSGNWRMMFMSALIPSVLLLGGLMYLPETPRWMASRGEFDAAAKILAKIEPPHEAERDLQELRYITKADQLGFRDLLQGRFLRPLIFGIVLAIIQQITGVNTIVYYAPTILQNVGFVNASSAILITFVIGAVGLAASLLSMSLVDKLGRRPLLMVSLALMAVTLFHLSFTLAQPVPTRWIVVADIICYLAAFNIGLGPIFWLLISEIYPTTVRGKAMSVATMTIWASDFLVTATFLTLVEHFGMTGCFRLFAVLCVFALAFSYWMTPETRGRTLEEIERSWGRVPSS